MYGQVDANDTNWHHGYCRLLKCVSLQVCLTYQQWDMAGWCCQNRVAALATAAN
jgi:hypothetical protein